MRESLTVLAILLIVVLTTALVGPYFVDWNAHRAEIETRVSNLVGAHVTVAGPLDVKLLPRPIFRMQDVSVAARDAKGGSVTVAELDLELSLTALLRGDVDFIDADLTAPTVTLPVGADGTVTLPAISASNADRISLTHIVLRDGTLVLRGADGRPAATLRGVAGEAEATSLAGPFKFIGSLDTPRGALPLRIATGALDDGRMRLKATIEASDVAPRLEIDGMLSAARPAGALGATLTYDGALTAGGMLPFGTDGTVVPWKLATKLHAEPGRIDLVEGELRMGADGRALIATLTGAVEGGANPKAHLALHATQADLGRLAVPADQTGAADPTAGASDLKATTTLPDDIAVLAALAGNADLTAALPLPLMIDAGIDTMSAGALTVTDVLTSLSLAPDRPPSGTFAAAMPDGTRARFEGSFEPGPGAVFKGRADLAAPHLQRLAEGLAHDLPDVAETIRRILPVDRFAAAGQLALSATGFAANDVALTLDRSSFAGTVTLTRGVGPDRPRLFADLTSDALDLDALPGWQETAKAAADLDLALSLSARALHFAPSDTGSVKAGRIAVQINKKGQSITLDRLSLADLGGATAEVTGRSDGRTAHVQGRVDAGNLRDLLSVANRVAPNPVLDRLRAGSDALSPAHLTIMAEASLKSDGGLTPTVLSLEGTAAATRLALSLHPDASTQTAGSETAGRSFAMTLSLEAPDAAALLRQGGIATAGGAIGRGRLDFTGHGDATGLGQGRLTATLGDAALSADGRSDPKTGTRATVALKGSNLAPLLRALRLATPESGAAWPVDAKGSLAYADGHLVAQDIAGRLIGTGFKGNLVYTPPRQAVTDAADGQPAITGTFALDRLPLPGLAGLVLGPQPPPKPGQLWPDAPFEPAPLTLPKAEVALTVTSMPLIGAETAEGVQARLRWAPGVLTLADLSAKLGGGRIGGTLTLRRDGSAASLAGRVDWSDLPIASAAIGGLSDGRLDLAGTGNSAASTIASLGGTGSLRLRNTRLPRFDPGAITRVIAGADTAPNTVDETALTESLQQELDKGALSLGTVETPVTVATGAIRIPSVRVTTPSVEAEASGSLDLASLLLSFRTTARLTKAPAGWVGQMPQVGVIWKGPFANPARDIDATTLVNGLASRAIARDQARIEAFQDDIRERAFFARRLKAIEAEQQATREKAKAEADRLRPPPLIQGAPLPPDGLSRKAAPPPRL